MDSEWLVVIAIALSVSFIVAASLSRIDDKLYGNFRHVWVRFQRKERLPDDKLLETRGANIAIFGMGRVGSGAYDKLRESHGDTVIGVDFDAELTKRHQSMGRNVLTGDPSDADFWEKIENNHNIELVMLALPNLESNLDALVQLRKISFSGRIAATAKYSDEEEQLRTSGATAVYNIYTEAGAGFAEHADVKT